jgi:hypothetical protein
MYAHFVVAFACVVTCRFAAAYLVKAALLQGASPLLVLLPRSRSS